MIDVETKLALEADEPAVREVVEEHGATLLAVAVLGVAAVAIAVAHWWSMGWAFPAAAAAIFFALAVAGEMAEVPVALGARRFNFAWGETSLLVGLAVVPLPLLVLLKTAALLTEETYRRRDWRRTTFNTLAAPPDFRFCSKEVRLSSLPGRHHAAAAACSSSHARCAIGDR